MAKVVSISVVPSNPCQRFARVKFLRNGDIHFSGLVLNLTPRQHQTFDQLLKDVTKELARKMPLHGPIDQLRWPNGDFITSLNEFRNGDISIACCVYERFVQMPYSLIAQQRIMDRGMEKQQLRPLPSKLVTMRPSLAAAQPLGQVAQHYFNWCHLIAHTEISQVHKVQHKKSKLQFALKLINKFSANPSEELEPQLLRQLQGSPYIIDLIMTYENERSLYMWFELMDCDLVTFMNSCKRRSESLVVRVFQELAEGILFIHSQQIVHRDIKPGNILLRLCGDRHIQQLKICDFGLAVIYNETKKLLKCGTPLYVAPEILTDRGYDFKVDCWATGVVIYVLACDKLPFKDSKEIIENPLKFPECLISQSLSNLIMLLLKKDPAERLNSEEMVHYSFENDSERQLVQL